MHVNLGGIGIGVAHEVLAYAGTDVAFFQLGAEQVADGMGVQLGGVDAGQLAVFAHHFKQAARGEAAALAVVEVFWAVAVVGGGK